MLVWTRDAVVKFEVFERIVVTDNTGQGHRRSILSIWMSHSEKEKKNCIFSPTMRLYFCFPGALAPTILESLFDGHVNFSDIMINIMVE